jgi:hypothetical protein
LVKLNIGYRAFFYFRTGYATYFAMFIGLINIMTTTYFLAIDKIPALFSVFPTFEIYIITVITIGIPIVVLAGWIHLKKIGTFSAEQNISAEIQPFNYRPLPGFSEIVIFPTYHEIVKLLIKKINNEGLSENEKNRLNQLEKDLIKLMNGGHVGNPPRGAF